MAWAMAGPLRLSVAVLEVGIPSCIGGYVFLEVVAKILFTLTWVVPSDASPPALASDSGDLAGDQCDKPVRWQWPFGPAAARGVPQPSKYHSPRFVAANASVAPFSLAPTFQVRV
jgi:hypothetical protein